jgi:hypothetical protein
MSTLAELQQLDDGLFHRLCDDLLPRLEARYSRLRTHGLNDKGESIKGQPDSYVGDTAETCRIAFAYSVQRAGWWNKLITDVQEVIRNSSGVEEIVFATSRDVNREGPKPKKGNRVDWLEAAKSAAAKATLRIIDGRELAGRLDRDHQDLRFQHLRIPYSRLSGASILESCRSANQRTVEGLKASGRYDPGRYVSRSPDHELYGLWQQALRATRDNSPREEPTRLIALVNDAGVGKTSLLCSFVESLGAVLPVLLLPARDLMEDPAHGLTRSIIERMQGSLEPGMLSQEETALVHHLPKDVPLTVVLDGLDESRDVGLVRRSIRQWLQSPLGQASLLIVSSRPEFWRQCSAGENWGRWMPRIMGDERTPTTTSWYDQARRHDPASGVRIPEQFSLADLERAWVRGGRAVEDLHCLPAATQAELRHPFTLRIFLDLAETHGAGQGVRTRTEVLGAWLDNRLAAEEKAEDYLTRKVYHDALRTIATKLQEVGSGSIPLDDLRDVRRFDQTSPPGPVVRRLLSANLLETVPDQPDRIRFAVEAVQDFYLGEADFLAVVERPTEVADRLGRQTFSEVHNRLQRLGQRIAGHLCRSDFVIRLASHDPAKAALVLQAAPLAYEPSVRSEVVGRLGQDVRSRFRMRGAFTVNLLASIACPEATACLLEQLTRPSDCPFHLRASGAPVFPRLGCVGGAGFTFKWPWFARSDDGSYYFQDMLAVLRTSPADFKNALADEALGRLGAESGSGEHKRAVCVLGYLADERAVPHLGERLGKNGILRQYENHALIAVGTEAAAEVFTRSAQIVAGLIHERRKTDKTGNDSLGLSFSISPHSADLHDLMTPAFEAAIIRFIRDDDRELSGIGLSLARTANTSALVYEILTCGKFTDIGVAANSYGLGCFVSPETWLEWWRDTPDGPGRGNLIRLAGGMPHLRIEQVLIECLKNTNCRVRALAASQLREMVSYRSAPHLRTILSEEDPAIDDWLKSSVVTALSRLRDPGAVQLLYEVAKTPVSFASSQAIYGLGEIGTPEAEAVLVRLYAEGVSEEHIAGSLVVHGSPTAVSKAIEIAAKRPEGPRWLGNQLRLALFERGHRVGQYYRHIALRQLVPYLASAESLVGTQAPPPKLDTERWGLVHNIEQLDGREVRELLYRWASRLGTPEDHTVRDDGLTFATLAYWELLNRGDDFAVPFYVKEAISEDQRRSWRAGDLRHFSSTAVARELRQALPLAEKPAVVAQIIRLLGFFGAKEDAGLLRLYMESEDDTLAGPAYEAFYRLTDPLRVPHHWDGL